VEPRPARQGARRRRLTRPHSHPTSFHVLARRAHGFGRAGHRHRLHVDPRGGQGELFPARIRALGVGLPYALTVAIFGGRTEYVAPWLKNAGHEPVFFWYVAGCALISLVVYGCMRESSTSSRIEREHSECVEASRT